jgi:Uma2 family endonuclease
MKAVVADVPEMLMQWRARSGADQWDEMWEGVLHMPPVPNREHQDFEFGLEAWLRQHWARPRGNKVYHQINLSGRSDWTHDYRIPDLVLLTPARSHIDRNEYFQGPPEVVVEIHSPDDEAYEKLPFYAKLGVPEVWILDRDSKTPEVFILREGEYRQQPPDASGWVASPATGIETRAESGGKLAIRLAGDAGTLALLPED